MNSFDEFDSGVTHPFIPFSKSAPKSIVGVNVGGNDGGAEVVGAGEGCSVGTGEDVGGNDGAAEVVGAGKGCRVGTGEGHRVTVGARLKVGPLVVGWIVGAHVVPRTQASPSRRAWLPVVGKVVGIWVGQLDIAKLGADVGTTRKLRIGC